MFFKLLDLVITGGNINGAIVIACLLLILPYGADCQVLKTNKKTPSSPIINKDNTQFFDGYRKELGVETFVYNGVRVNAYTGIEENKDNYSSTDYISTVNYGRICYVLPFSASAGIAFYDANKRIISSLAQVSTGGEEYDDLIPEGVKYVRLSRRNDGNRSTRIVLYGASYVSEKDFFPFQEAENARMINPRYLVFSNNEYKIEETESGDFYQVAMPNHQMLNDGSIVVIAELFGGNKRCLAIKRSSDGGKTWDNRISFEGELLQNGIITDNDSGGNPVLLYDRKKDNLFLFYQPCSYRKSSDGGITWGAKKSLASLFLTKYDRYHYYASPCNGIQLTNGILAIAYRIEDINKDYDRVCVLFSRDNGDTWEITAPTPIVDEKGNTIYADETALVEYKKNCIMLNSRGFSEAYMGKRINRRVFVPKNKGASSRKRWRIKEWTLESISDLKLLDPVCQGSLVKVEYQGKQFGVFCNVYSDNATRTDLLLRVSADFKHWSQFTFLSLPGEVIHGYSSMCCINETLSIVSEDARGVYYMPFGYEFMDKLMRSYAENLNAYKK